MRLHLAGLVSLGRGADGLIPEVPFQQDKSHYRQHSEEGEPQEHAAQVRTHQLTAPVDFVPELISYGCALLELFLLLLELIHLTFVLQSLLHFE